MLETIVEGDPKAPFSTATTPRRRGKPLFLSLDCSTLPLICTLYCWVLSKEVSSTIFKVIGMTQTGIEPRSPRPLANTLSTGKVLLQYEFFISLEIYLIILTWENNNWKDRMGGLNYWWNSWSLRNSQKYSTDTTLLSLHLPEQSLTKPVP